MPVTCRTRSDTAHHPAEAVPSWPPGSPGTTRDFRDVMGQFATGVAVVTTELRGQPQGMTLNALTSVSLDPRLLLICLQHGSATAAALRERGSFVLNLLTDHQEEIARQFARPGEDHMAVAEWRTNEHGLPGLENVLARIVCHVEMVYDGGDHHIVLGRALDHEIGDGEPLLFFRGQFYQWGKKMRNFAA